MPAIPCSEGSDTLFEEVWLSKVKILEAEKSHNLPKFLKLIRKDRGSEKG